MISIGAVYRGPELEGSRVDQRITLLMNAAARLRGDFEFGSTPAINVVFYVPGSLGKFDFNEARDAKFSKKQKLLMVQIPVPEKEVDSPALDQFLILSLHGANAIAFHYFAEKGIDYPLREAEKFVFRLHEEITGGLPDPLTLR